MVVAPLMSWKRSDLPGVLGRLKFAAAGTALVVLAVLWLQGGGPVLALIGIAFGAWCVFGAMTDIAERIRLFRIPLGDSLSRALGLPRSAWGAALAHGGLGVALLGMIATSFWSTERLELAKPGDRIDIAAGYAVEFDGVRVGQGPNYELREGDLKLFHNGRFLSDLAPEKRFYPVARMPTSEVAIHTTLIGDVYVALGEAQPPLPPPAGAVDLGRRPDHGLRRRPVAQRPPAAGRRAAAGGGARRRIAGLRKSRCVACCFSCPCCWSRSWPSGSAGCCCPAATRRRCPRP